MTDQSARFEVMLQLLLVKIYDEHSHPKDEQEMSLQDYTDAPLGDKDVIESFEKILEKALKFYGKYLPKAVSNRMKVDGSSLRGISAMLAPIVIFGSKRDVIQDFYMYFAKGVYKWDLAQYFTPTEVVDFIVTLTNPQAGDQVKDPACGSADFLISSLHHTKKYEADIRDAVWGADHSENAVQISVLNMVLNGDGKSNIRHEDSLLSVEQSRDSYSVMLCNPPFGIKIVERRFDVLKKFDMAHVWEQTEDGCERTERVQVAQETGLLFAELCVKQATPGGRIGIILPNGYLGNRSTKYLAFREWLLRHVKLVAVVGFPRFTFKKSGADVSASVVLMEKRETPLKRARDSGKYPFYAALLESVGWSVGDKRAERIFTRHEETGTVLVNEANEPIIDADFDRVLKDLYGSPVPSMFRWLTAGVNTKGRKGGWSIPIQSVFDRDDLSIDPKRWCQRVSLVREKVAAMPHFCLGDVVDVIAQEKNQRTQVASTI